jgi:hypothetical protein
VTGYCSCGALWMDIDHYGERLTGCIDCNSWRSSRRAFIVHLSVEDIRALRELETNGRKARSVR